MEGHISGGTLNNYHCNKRVLIMVTNHLRFLGEKPVYIITQIDGTVFLMYDVIAAQVQGILVLD